MTEAKVFKKTADQERATALISGDATNNLLFGGSRSGKTALLIYAIQVRAWKAKGSRHLILRQKFNHIKTSIWYDTWPKVWKMAWPGIPYKEHKSDGFITMPNGSEVWMGGLDDKERVEKILGNEYATIFLNEISQMSYHGYTTALTRLAQKTDLVNKMYLDCNPPPKTHWSYPLFVKNEDPTSREAKDPKDYVSMRLNPDGNIENLSQKYLEALASLPLRQRRRYLHGEWLDEVEGALWKQTAIDKSRVLEAPECEKIVVAVDPAGSSEEGASETGIVVCGRDDIQHGYVIEDASDRYSPNAWGKKAVALYHQYKANYIVAEKNNGGDMVKAVIKNIDKDVPVRLVSATKGKLVRAEPISSLYEEDRIHHVGIYPELEEQMTTYTGKPGEESPDRMDALVWGMSMLFVKGSEATAEPDVVAAPESESDSFFDSAVVA